MLGKPTGRVPSGVLATTTSLQVENEIIGQPR